jgi:hypothetical protein
MKCTKRIELKMPKGEELELELPLDAKILTVKVYNYVPTMWIEYDNNEKRTMKKTFYVVGDHAEFPYNRTHISTCVWTANNGKDYYFHVYMKK